MSQSVTLVDLSSFLDQPPGTLSYLLDEPSHPTCKLILLLCKLHVLPNDADAFAVQSSYTSSTGGR